MASKYSDEITSDSDTGHTERTRDTGSDQCPERGPFCGSAGSDGHSSNFIPEDEVFSEGETSDTKLQDCKKNRGHEGFIPVKDFTPDHLPVEARTDDVMNCILDLINRTVLIEVTYTSKDRPDTFCNSPTPYPDIEKRGYHRRLRTGTGCIQIFDGAVLTYGDCPCHECEESGSPKKKYWEFQVTTSTHVVFDESEALKTEIKCFYNTDKSDDGIVKLYCVGIKDGNKAQAWRYDKDTCDELICVTHDEESGEKINRVLEDTDLFFQYENICNNVIVSHPHGGIKMISLGKVLYYFIPLQPEYLPVTPYKIPIDTTCYVPSDTTREEYVSHNFRVKPLHTCGSAIRSLYESNTEHYHGAATFTLPEDAKYVVRYSVGDKYQWSMTFHPGTTFSSSDGTPIQIPDNTEFVKGLPGKVMPFQNVGMHAVYDTPTCPGSSGAVVIQCILDSHLSLNCYMARYTHSGYDSDNKWNKGSVGYWNAHI